MAHYAHGFVIFNVVPTRKTEEAKTVDTCRLRARWFSAVAFAGGILLAHPAHTAVIAFGETVSDGLSSTPTPTPLSALGVGIGSVAGGIFLHRVPEHERYCGLSLPAAARRNGHHQELSRRLRILDDPHQWPLHTVYYHHAAGLLPLTIYGNATIAIPFGPLRRPLVSGPSQSDLTLRLSIPAVSNFDQHIAVDYAVPITVAPAVVEGIGAFPQLADATTIPEPAGIGVLILGLGCLALVCRRASFRVDQFTVRGQTVRKIA